MDKHWETYIYMCSCGDINITHMYVPMYECMECIYATSMYTFRYVYRLICICTYTHITSMHAKYIYMYICLYIHIKNNMHGHTCVWMYIKKCYTHTYVVMDECVCAHVYVWIYAIWMYTFMYVYHQTWVYISIYMSEFIHICM